MKDKDLTSDAVSTIQVNPYARRLVMHIDIQCSTCASLAFPPKTLVFSFSFWPSNVKVDKDEDEHCNETDLPKQASFKSSPKRSNPLRVRHRCQAPFSNTMRA